MSHSDSKGSQFSKRCQRLSHNGSVKRGISPLDTPKKLERPERISAGLFETVTKLFGSPQALLTAGFVFTDEAVRRHTERTTERTADGVNLTAPSNVNIKRS